MYPLQACRRESVKPFITWLSMSPMASYIGLLKSRFDGSVAAASAATAVDIEEAAVAVEDDTLPRWKSVGGFTWENSFIKSRNMREEYSRWTNSNIVCL